MAEELPAGASDGLANYWTKPLSESATVTLPGLLEQEAERHRIYSLLTMALVSAYWNGNKYGAEGDYPWRPNQKKSNGSYAGDKAGDRYLGHNIACVAVDENGELIDFEFNHNELTTAPPNTQKPG